MFSLACQVSSMQLHSACVLQQSSLCCSLCAQTTSSYWCRAPHPSPGCLALRVGSIQSISSFALTLQIIAWSLRQKQFSVTTIMAHVSRVFFFIRLNIFGYCCMYKVATSEFVNIFQIIGKTMQFLCLQICSC